MRRVFDRVVEEGGEFEVQEFRVGRTNDEPSFARIEIRTADPHALDRILEAVRYLGATTEVGDCAFAPAEADGILPDAFYSTTNFDTFVRIEGRWVEARDQKMDSALVLRGGAPSLRQAGAGEAGRAGGAARARHPGAAPRAQPRLRGVRLHVERRLRRDQQGHRDPGGGEGDEARAGGGGADRGGARARRRALGRGRPRSPRSCARGGWTRSSPGTPSPSTTSRRRSWARASASAR